MFEVPEWNLGAPVIDGPKTKSKEEKQKKHDVSKNQPVKSRQNERNEKAPQKEKTKELKRSQETVQERKPQEATTQERKFEPANTQKVSKPKTTMLSKLQDKMQEKLAAGRFRYLNELLYTSKSHDALSHFTQNPDDFSRYHEGFRQQVEQWPMNPVELCIAEIRDMITSKGKPRGKKNHAFHVVDMGCGDAKIAATFAEEKDVRVSSFDLAAVNERVVAADITKPLPGIDASTANTVIFSLSLMNANWLDSIDEAHRILINKGTLLIAEVESRLAGGEEKFLEALRERGFRLLGEVNKKHNVFWMARLEKTQRNAQQGQPTVDGAILRPCIYKKR